MASADIAMDIRHHEDSADGRRSDYEPLVKYYRASEPLPGVKPVLHNFLKKGPASWAAVQVSSGVLSVGIGVVFAVSFNMELYLTLFRVPILTGIMFIFTGVLSNLLYKYPELLQTCFFANIGCLSVSAVGMILLSLDLQGSGHKPGSPYQMEVLVLCVTLMDMIIAAVLIFFTYKESQNHKH